MIEATVGTVPTFPSVHEYILQSGQQVELARYHNISNFLSHSNSDLYYHEDFLNFVKFVKIMESYSK